MAPPDQVKNIFSDVYKLYLSCNAMDNTDKNWKLALEESNRITKKYNNCNMITEMIKAVHGQVYAEKGERNDL